MKITIIDKTQQDGELLISRSFCADALINNNVSLTLPDLRANRLFVEIRKLLLHSRFDADALCKPWDENRLAQLEIETGPIDIEASFPHRFSAPRMLTAAVAVQVIEKAIKIGRQELKFYVDWFPFSSGHSAVKAATLAEECLFRSTAPFREAVSSRAQQTYETLKLMSRRFQWERKGLGKTAGRFGYGQWENLEDNWYGM